jgi:uncharacterized membrane protein
MHGYGFVVGLAASLMGISGGSISNMILTLYGKTIHKAVATSAGLGACAAKAPARNSLRHFPVVGVGAFRRELGDVMRYSFCWRMIFSENWGHFSGSCSTDSCA